MFASGSKGGSCLVGIHIHLSKSLMGPIVPPSTPHLSFFFLGSVLVRKQGHRMHLPPFGDHSTSSSCRQSSLYLGSRFNLGVCNLQCTAHLLASFTSLTRYPQVLLKSCPAPLPSGTMRSYCSSSTLPLPLDLTPISRAATRHTVDIEKLQTFDSS